MTRKVALVTGAARGIGLATAKLFEAQGWLVGMLDRDREALMAAVQEVGTGFALPYDISIPQEVERAFADLRIHHGRLDALVNNAGVADFGPIEDTDFARWRKVMQTNLDGTFLCSQAAIPLLKSSRSLGISKDCRAETQCPAVGS